MVLTTNTTEQKERIINPIERPTLAQELSENVILTTVDDLYNWSRLSSLWPLLFGTACCFIEFAALIGLRFDFNRFGLIRRSSPRQADLIITAGTINMKKELTAAMGMSVPPALQSAQKEGIRRG
jgi:NAD(P)H-quinone oxidoreductase subunit K